MSYHRVRNEAISSTRLNIIFGCFVFFFILINLRLFQIQVLGHKKYETLAKEQYSDIGTLPSKRGEILTSDGYVLSSTQMRYLLYIEPKLIKEPEKFSHELATAMTKEKVTELRNAPPEDVLNPQEAQSPDEKKIFGDYYDKIYKGATSNLFWVPIERNITPTTRTTLEALKIPGFGFEDEPIRYYPEGTLAAHVLGFVASDEKGEKVGYYGIEGSLDQDLRGKPGKVYEETDAAGVPILSGNYKRIEPIPGRNIILTINRAVQYTIEKKLKEGVEKYNAKSGQVIVMDPFTGDVIALANYPTYDPSNFSVPEKEVDEKSHRKNLERKDLAISQTYEPGSVIKPFTVSAGIDLKLITPETTFDDTGSVYYSGYEIHNWDFKHLGVLNIIQLLQKSNNVGAAWVGHKVGKDMLYKYFVNFGLGTKTGVDLQDEDTGILRDPREWADIDLATASFGQGISATPLQVINAFNAIANGGFLLEPKIIAKIQDGPKDTILPTKTIRRVIQRDTSETMTSMLEKAVEGGEAKFFTLKDYRISGKTGTAQIPENGTYSPDRTNATFVGYLTASKRFSMIVKLEEPKTSIYASETAVPLWMDIATELVKFYGIAPDGDLSAVSKEPSTLVED